MALSVETLLSLMALFFFMVANKVHSQSFTITSFDPNPTDLIYQGDAHVPHGSQNLRLTKTDSWCSSQTRSVGRVLYSTPIQLYNRFTPGREATIATQISFRHRVTSGSGADGLSFFIAPAGTTLPCDYCSSGGHLGIYNSSGTTPPIFAVEVDTFSNPEWDPEYPHLGININSRESRNTTRYNALGQSFLLVIYNATTKNVQAIAFGNTPVTMMTYDIDLTTVLPDWVQVGVSAATGSDPSNLGVHEILFWTLNTQVEPTGVSLHDMIIHPQYDHLVQEYLRT